MKIVEFDEIKERFLAHMESGMVSLEFDEEQIANTLEEMGNGVECAIIGAQSIEAVFVDHTDEEHPESCVCNAILAFIIAVEPVGIIGMYGAVSPLVAEKQFSIKLAVSNASAFHIWASSNNICAMPAHKLA